MRGLTDERVSFEMRRALQKMMLLLQLAPTENNLLCVVRPNPRRGPEGYQARLRRHAAIMDYSVDVIRRELIIVELVVADL